MILSVYTIIQVIKRYRDIAHETNEQFNDDISFGAYRALESILDEIEGDYEL